MGPKGPDPPIFHLLMRSELTSFVSRGANPKSARDLSYFSAFSFALSVRSRYIFLAKKSFALFLHCFGISDPQILSRSSVVYQINKVLLDRS